MTRWVTMCRNCVRYGYGHDKECTCTATTHTPPTAVPAEPPPVDAFTALQEQRDYQARCDNTVGDFCRRWVTCGRCHWTSPEVHLWSDMDAEENYHMMWGCPAPKPGPATVIDPDIGWLEPTEQWQWFHRIEPAEEPALEPVPRHDHRTVWAGRRQPFQMRVNIPTHEQEAA